MTSLASGLLELRGDTALREAVFRWKSASWDRLMRDVLHGVEFAPQGKTVVEVGAHDGGLSLFFTRLGSNAICSDARVERSAAALHNAWGARCSYLVTDATRLSLRPATIDAVVMKSVLGGIYARVGRDGARQTIREIHHALKPGGFCLLLEQLRGDPLTNYVRTRYLPRDWHYFSPEELTSDGQDSLIEPFSSTRQVCRTFASHIVEEYLSAQHPIVSAACRVDRFVERYLRADWLHLIGVVAVK